MRSEPVMIDGLAGPVVIDVNSFTGKHAVTVGGQVVKGTRRGQYELPGANGQPVSARLRTAFFNPYPSIEIAGVKHETGPGVPLALRILALLPLLLFGFGGAIPILLGLTSVLINMAILRMAIPTAAKVVSMIGVFVGAVLAILIIAAAVYAR